MPRRGTSVATAVADGGGGRRLARQEDREAAADARGALDGHATAVDLTDVLHDRQTQAGAAEVAAARRVDAVEALEQARQVPPLDAAALVGDLDRDLVVAGRPPRPSPWLRRGCT